MTVALCWLNAVAECMCCSTKNENAAYVRFACLSVSLYRQIYHNCKVYCLFLNFKTPSYNCYIK